MSSLWKLANLMKPFMENSLFQPVRHDFKLGEDLKESVSCSYFVLQGPCKKFTLLKCFSTWSPLDFNDSLFCFYLAYY